MDKSWGGTDWQWERVRLYEWCCWPLLYSWGSKEDIAKCPKLFMALFYVFSPELSPSKSESPTCVWVRLLGSCLPSLPHNYDTLSKLWGLSVCQTHTLPWWTMIADNYFFKNDIIRGCFGPKSFNSLANNPLLWFLLVYGEYQSQKCAL